MLEKKTNYTIIAVIAIIFMGVIAQGITSANYNPIYLTNSTNSTRIEYISSTNLLYITNNNNISFTNNDRTSYQTIKTKDIYSTKVVANNLTLYNETNSPYCIKVIGSTLTTISGQC